MIFVFLLVTLTLVGAYYFYRAATKNETYFKDLGLPHMKPVFFWGNSLDLFGKKKNMFEFIKDMYDAHPSERIIGFYGMRQPQLLPRDPELIKQLTVKEFDHFSDHKVVIDEKMDSLLGNSLISLSGQKWKDMRATLSPSFTGSKMRLMFQLIAEVCEQMVEQLKSETAAGADKENVLSMEMKDFSGRFTNDIIALTAFGLKANSMKEKDNEFYTFGQQVMNFASPKKAWKFIGARMAPRLMKAFKFEFIEGHLKKFFGGIVLNTMDYREKNNIHRPDMVSLLMEARKAVHAEAEGEVKRQWTDDEIIAQCFLFFLAGFDTSSTVMSFALYELATNPDLQEILYGEIAGVVEELQGKPLTYDIIKNLPYLDGVVAETLRLYPPAPFTDRIAMKDFEFDDGKGFKFQFTKGFNIWVPIYGLHMDPKYFPNPKKFDPERFIGDNKANINQDCYMPFGVGPRNCIASRFALMEVKAFLFYLIANFSINVTEKTQIPLKIKASIGPVQTEKGIWVGFKRR